MPKNNIPKTGDARHRPPTDQKIKTKQLVSIKIPSASGRKKGENIVDEKKKKRGAPLKEYKKEYAELLLKEMENGASQIEVCRKIGIWEGLFYSWIEKNPSFSRAYEFGKMLCKGWWLEQGRINLGNRAFNGSLYFFNMKNRFGWHEQKPRYPEIPIENFEGTIQQKIEAIAIMLKKGKISIDQHNQIMNSLMYEAQINERLTYEKRIENLEEQAKNSKNINSHVSNDNQLWVAFNKS